jgi:hypothetical protein
MFWQNYRHRNKQEEIRNRIKARLIHPVIQIAGWIVEHKRFPKNWFGHLLLLSGFLRTAAMLQTPNRTPINPIEK